MTATHFVTHVVVKICNRPNYLWQCGGS